MGAKEKPVKGISKSKKVPGTIDIAACGQCSSFGNVCFLLLHSG